MPRPPIAAAAVLIPHNEIKLVNHASHPLLRHDGTEETRRGRCSEVQGEASREVWGLRGDEVEWRGRR